MAHTKAWLTKRVKIDGKWKVKQPGHLAVWWKLQNNEMASLGTAGLFRAHEIK